MPVNIIFAGAPGSGKGTQCEKLVEKYGFVHISTGDILRDEVKKGTPLGLQAKQVMESGGLVSDEIMIPIVKQRLAQPDCLQRGWILDGFPRTGVQAKALTSAGIRPDVFIHLDVPEEILVERIIHRRSDPVTGKVYHLKFNPPPTEEIKSRLVHRSDDAPDKVLPRFKNFASAIKAIQSEYASIEVRIQANRDIKTVTAEVFAAVDKAAKKGFLSCIDFNSVLVVAFFLTPILSIAATACKTTAK